MAESFDGLRAYVGSVVRQPDFGIVQGRARRLRRRRAITGVVTAVVLALGLGYAVQAVPDRHSQPAVPRPTPTIGVSAPQRADISAGGRHELYYLTGDCRECADRLYASTDDGASWQPRSLPPAVADVGAHRTGTVTALGSGVLAWTDLSDGAAVDENRPLSFQRVSINGGRTWQPVVVDDGPVAAVPAGTAAVGCGEVDRPSPCLVYAVDPATGRFAPLAAQPAGIAFEAASSSWARVPIGAGLWVTGVDPGSRMPAVASSRDGGRTWHTSYLAPGRTATALHGAGAAQVWATIEAGANGVAYAEVPEERTNQLVFRTTDGGLTWKNVSHLGERPIWGVVTPGGAHLIQTGLVGNAIAIFTMLDSIGRYEPVVMDPILPLGPFDLMQPAVGLFVLEPPPGAGYLSADGLTWRQMNLPGR